MQNYNKVDEKELNEIDSIKETKKIEKRANFKSDVINALYKSVGGLCSKCHRYTIARNPKTNKYVSIGEAAHIFGAKRFSNLSPRANSEMTDKQIASFENAIWLCRNCHRQVDYDQGEFNSDDLKEMKEKAEQLAYDLLNKDIEKIDNTNYEKFELHSFSKLQLCLIHRELILNDVGFDLADGEKYIEFVRKLRNNPLYVRYITVTEDDTMQTTDFRWSKVWNLFQKYGFGNIDENYYSIYFDKLLLLIYKNYTYLLKEPILEKEIEKLIPDVLYLTKVEVDKVFSKDLMGYENELEKINEEIILLIQNMLNPPLSQKSK